MEIPEIMPRRAPTTLSCVAMGETDAAPSPLPLRLLSITQTLRLLFLAAAFGFVVPAQRIMKLDTYAVGKEPYLMKRSNNFSRKDCICWTLERKPNSTDVVLTDQEILEGSRTEQ